VHLINTMTQSRSTSATAAGLLAAVLLSAAPLSAQTAAPASAPLNDTTDPAQDAEQDIVVVGDNGNLFRLTADSLRDAARAYQQHHVTYAPGATLYLLVESADSSSLDGVDVYLRARRRGADGDRATISLPLDTNQRAVLPVDQVATGQWELRTNRTRGGIRIRPLVLSPGSSLPDRRFGDLRLQCRVSIAFARLSLPMRALAGALGPCSSSRVTLLTRATRPISAANITGYATPLTIRDDGVTYAVPLHDQSITNEARLRLTYR
jgi:hypothetical protein